MGLLSKLAEANIKDFQRRLEAGEATMENDNPLSVGSFESQVFNEIIELQRAARDTDDPVEKDELKRAANSLRIRLMVAVERDRPLLAQTLARMLAQDR